MDPDPRRNREGLADFFRLHPHPGGIIVCEEPKFIYMKPSKTAGTSILRHGLQNRLEGIFHHKDHPERFAEWIGSITDEELEEYFIFSVVRNPWDRLVSIASYFDFPFKEFVRRLDAYWEDEIVRVHSLPLHLYTHQEGVPFVDFICRFESLQADMNLVFDRIGLGREPLAFVNRSRHRHYSVYYGREEVEVVESLYAQDIEYHGYMFEGRERGWKGLMGRLRRR